jgi:hypothetical protein
MAPMNTTLINDPPRRPVLMSAMDAGVAQKKAYSHFALVPGYIERQCRDGGGAQRNTEW